MCIEYVQTGAIILTLLVLIWYTIETSGLRRSAKEQNELSILPCITLCFPDLKERIPVFKNIGRGPAFNIFIKDYVSPASNEKISFSTIDFLGPDQVAAISFSLISPDSAITYFKDMDMKIFPLHIYDFEVHYQSLEGDWYSSTLSTNLKDMRFIFKTIKKLSRKDAMSLAAGVFNHLSGMKK